MRCRTWNIIQFQLIKFCRTFHTNLTVGTRATEVRNRTTHRASSNSSSWSTCTGRPSSSRWDSARWADEAPTIRIRPIRRWPKERPWTRNWSPSSVKTVPGPIRCGRTPHPPPFCSLNVRPCADHWSKIARNSLVGRPFRTKNGRQFD